jgi:channel protein (hemolysin III family)
MLVVISVKFKEIKKKIQKLKLGGIVYVIGVISNCNGRIQLAHAIWHLFVVAGSMIHYLAVINYLFEAERQQRGVLVFGKFEAIRPIHSEL